MKKVFILIALFFIFFFSGCEKKQKIFSSGNEIKIGILAPLDGLNKRRGEQSLRGIEAARELQPYLHNGDKIKFIIQNTHSTFQGTQVALKNLKKENVKVIISFLGSDQMLHVKKEFSTIKIPIVTTLATNDEIIDLSSSTTQVCVSNKTQAIVASHFIKDEKLMNNVLVLYYSNNLYAKELEKEFVYYFKQLGGNIDAVFDLSDPKNMQKFEKFDKQDIDMIFCITSIDHSIKTMNIVKEQNLKAQVLFSDGFISSLLAKDKEKFSLFEGVYVIEHFTYKPKLYRKKKSFFKKLQKYNLKQSSYALLAYDAYALLYQVLERCGDQYAQKCLQRYFLNIPLVKGIFGNFSIVESRARREIYVNKITHAQLIQEIVTY